MSKFRYKGFGAADVILSIKLIKGENGITLTQSHYVEKVLSRFGFKDNKPAPTPYDPSLILRKNKRISFIVSKLSRFTSNPGNG